MAVSEGSKILAFNISMKALIRRYPIPDELLANGINANDVRINNTVRSGGFAFITNESRMDRSSQLILILAVLFGDYSIRPS